MSYLARLSNKGKAAVRVAMASHTVKNKMVTTVEYGFASFAFGYLQNRYREKASVNVFGKRLSADLAAGVGLKAISLGLSLFGKYSAAVPHLEAVGNAGIGAFMHTLGSGYGSKAAGVRRILLQESDVAKVKSVIPNATVLGEIPAAPHGAYLTPSQLASLA